MEDYKNKLLRRILRAFKDYTTEKYKLSLEAESVHVHELVACKYKSEIVREIPELANPLKPPIFIGEAIDNLLKELFLKDGVLRSLTETVEGLYKKELDIGDKKIILVGKPDIVLKDMIVEVKYTQFDEGLPLDHHVKQVMLYLYLTGKNMGKLVYVTNRGFKEFEISEKFDDNSLREYIKAWSSPRYEWECQYCNFKQICPYYTKRSENSTEKVSEGNE